MKDYIVHTYPVFALDWIWLISIFLYVGISEHDNEGRVITAEYDKFYLVSTCKLWILVFTLLHKLKVEQFSSVTFYLCIFSSKSFVYFLKREITFFCPWIGIYLTLWHKRLDYLHIYFFIYLPMLPFFPFPTN